MVSPNQQSALSAGSRVPSNEGVRVPVLLPLPLKGPYDYVVGDALTVAPGEYVRVPLGGRVVLGVVWDGAPDGGVPVEKLKEIIERVEAPPMPPVLRRFVEWVARYTVSAPGAVLRMALASAAAFEPVRTRSAYIAGGPIPERMTAARRRVVATALESPPLPIGLLASEAGVTESVVRGLIDAGTLLPVALPADRPFPEPQGAPSRRDLSRAQEEAAAALRSAVVARDYAPFLLDGVTGSGKTEVYFEAIAALLDQGGQALILLPEIALSVQFLERFAARFGCRPAEWHSDLTPGERRRTARALARGDVRVVVGARSALFLPYPDLRLIVVDEEHERAFKQEEGVVYHARDMAVVRAKLANIPIVLASATPSLETIANVDAGRYRRLQLPERAGRASMPDVETIDLRIAPPERGGYLSSPLIAAVGETLNAGEQVLLFLNRRGYAPLTLCRTCGHRMACPNCRTWLVEHRYRRRLMCHHCGFERDPPTACPQCSTSGTLVPCGPGVERIAEEAAQRFPNARLEVLSSDAMEGPHALEAALGRIAAHEVDLIVGTQLVAKGHHFPLLTLVGVVDADLGLEGGDLRAAERTFQLLHQVAGRSGRAERPGRALIQTFNPEHPVIGALLSGNRDAFLARESDGRRQLGYPPFGKLAAVIVSGHEEKAVARVARELAACAPRGDAVHVLGPAPAPLAVLRGRHRMRLLLKAERSVDVSAMTREWLSRIGATGPVRVTIDIDPYSFM